MTALEERIAEAIDNALFDPQGIRRPTYADAARAVVAVLDAEEKK